MDHERLFTYGTLQLESVQLSTFGRTLDGGPDALVGYRVRMIERHRNLEFTGSTSDCVEGTVFSLSQEELEQADAYEPHGYQRIRVNLRSGGEAWVYLNKLIGERA